MLASWMNWNINVHVINCAKECINSKKIISFRQVGLTFLKAKSFSVQRRSKPVKSFKRYCDELNVLRYGHVSEEDTLVMRWCDVSRVSFTMGKTILLRCNVTDPRFRQRRVSPYKIKHSQGLSLVSFYKSKRF